MSWPMTLSTSRIDRRAALRAGGLSLAASLGAPLLNQASAQEADLNQAQDGLSADIIEIFKTLPGTKSLKLSAPPDAGRPAWEASLDPDRELFIASSFKTFVLAEYLLQVEDTLDPSSTTPLSAQLTTAVAEELPLDEEVFAPGALVLNPPNLNGKITAHTAMEAMIAQSDNTATDIALRRAGPDQVRQLIASLGLESTRIPESTRQFFAYILADPDWQTITWPRLLTLIESDPFPHRPIVNDQVSMTSTPNDLVAFYSHVFQGGLFRYPETLALFRAFLSQANTIALSMSLGVNAFVKSGWIGSLPGFESDGGLSIAGAAFIRSRWVYFSLIVNWPAAEGSLAEIEPSFFAATNDIFTLVRDRLVT